MKSRLFSFGSLAFCLIFIGLFVGGRNRFFQDPGTFWHTKTGHLILGKKQFLSTDPYSFTFGGQPWTPYEWLGEVCMALLYRLAGFELLFIVTITILATTFAWLGQRISRTGLHYAAVATLIGLAIAAASNHFHVRPHILTILFFAVTMVVLSHVESRRWSIHSLLLLMPLFIVWTNTHGGALGSYATVAIVFFVWLVSYVLHLNSPIKTTRELICFIVYGLLIASTAIMTPYGIDVFHVWLKLMQMPELKSFVIEHMPLNWRDPKNSPFLILGTIYLFLLAGLKQFPRATWLIPLIWFYLGCDRCRHASLFAIVALVAIADLFPHTRWADWLAKNRPDYYIRPEEKQIQPIRLRFVDLLLCWLPPMITIAIGLIICLQHKIKLDQTRWPTELIESINQFAKPNQKQPIFNEYNDGGFVIWFLPDFQPMLDDRCEVYGGKWLLEFTEISQCNDNKKIDQYFAAIEAKHQPFHFAIARKNSCFDVYFSENQNWVKVQASQNHVFYKKK